MENIYIKLLKEFEDTGLSSKRSISKFMEKNFEKPTATTTDEWQKQNEDARQFLEDVRGTGHFDLLPYEFSHIGKNYTTNEYRWYDVVDINARLTISGMDFLESHNVNKRVTANSNLQTLAIALTVLLTAITLIVTLRNSTSDKQVDRLQAHIREQTQQLHTLQIQLSQATNMLLLEKEAKKDLPKKP